MDMFEMKPLPRVTEGLDFDQYENPSNPFGYFDIRDRHYDALNNDTLLRKKNFSEVLMDFKLELEKGGSTDKDSVRLAELIFTEIYQMPARW